MMVQSQGEFTLLPLVRMPQYCNGCISMLNQEWPRSISLRMNSLHRCMSEVPDLSLIMLSSDRKLVGHARLCRMPLDDKGCWIESVIIRNDLRGKGVGRILMELLEQKASALGFSMVYLSTEDKMEFYKKCGYQECPPVLHAGSGMKLLTSSGFNNILTSAHSPPNKLQDDKTHSGVTAKVANSPPPPPPPPANGSIPANGNHVNTLTKKTKTYFCKSIPISVSPVDCE